LDKEEKDIADLISAVVNIDEDEVLKIVNDRLKEEDPKNIIEDLRIGIERMSEKFSMGGLSLSELAIGCKIFGTAMQNIDSLLKDRVPYLGKIVIGMVEGDTNDLGKNIVASLLRCAGFFVCDLGVDVPKEKFVEKVKELGPEILAISCHLDNSDFKIKKVVKSVEEEGLREKVKVMVGGKFVDEEWRKEVGADAYCKDAYEGVEVAKRFLTGR